MLHKRVAKWLWAGYTGGLMSEEPEDYNAFDKWDAVGAAAMLGLFPAVVHFIFSKHDIPGTLTWLVVPVVAALAVYLSGFLFSGKSLGRIVNLVGLILTPIFLIIACFYWAEAIERDFPTRDANEPKPEQQAKP